MIFNLPEAYCMQCGKHWTPRKSYVRVCPRCGSIRWNKQKTKLTKKEIKECNAGVITIDSWNKR